MALTVPVPRHLEPRPEDLRSRLARLGNPEELTGMEPPIQRLANFLIAAERELSHVQTRFFEAQRSGDAEVIAAAAARKAAAEAAIGSLRVQLFTERRRQLLQRGEVAPAASVDEQRSLMQRFIER
jgi:hypothetical protein